ncbi:hypothetical protein H4Q26_001200 [Puccinia striiformis f. sp. tritici PST-130]|nr:hypothetical protein H4Q26_001200 [Puccinia striiformis f. sp. tritici PST-130]
MVWGFSSSFSFYVALIIWHSGIANIKLALCLQPRIAESFILPAGRLDCTEKNSQEGALLSGWATKQARSKRVDVTRSKELSNETPSNDDSARKWGRYRGRSSRPRARTMGWSPSSTSAQENTLDAVLRGIFEEIPWAGNPNGQRENVLQYPNGLDFLSKVNPNPSHPEIPKVIESLWSWDIISTTLLPGARIMKIIHLGSFRPVLDLSQPSPHGPQVTRSLLLEQLIALHTLV